MAGCTPSIPDSALASRLPNPRIPEFILVAYEPAPLHDPPPEIQSTAKYDELRPSIHSVALRVPDACIERKAGPDGGRSLKAVCERWIVPIERSLSSAGLAVFAWDVVVDVERTKNLTPYAAAKDLGADLILVFDHLDAYDLRRAPPARDELRVYAADAEGHTFGPRLVNEITTAGLTAFVDEIAGDRTDAQAVLGATASLPATGETIWYYKDTRTTRLGDVAGLRFLFGRHGSEGPWNPIRPQPTVDGSPWPMTSAYAIRRERQGSGPANREERDRLLSEGAAAFVRALVGSK